MKDKYWLLFKTGDAEARALQRTKFEKNKVVPIIELTRGRKSKKDKIGLLSKRVDKIKEIFAEESICLDLTTDESLSNSEIDSLYTANNGYENWLSFLLELKEEEIFKEIIPTILVDIEDEKIHANLKKQVKDLSNNFSKIAYRHSIADDGYYEDLELIKDVIESKDVTFNFIIDCEYVPSGAYKNTIELVNARIEKVKKLLPKANFIIVSTSFPRYVSDIGNDDTDTFRLNEIDIFYGIKKQHSKIMYGDYGSINPIRNDEVFMARGWIPRIDIPTLTEIYYYRERRKQRDYSDVYTIVAKRVYRDERFPKHLSRNWGIKQVLICKNGNAPGSSPGFWISVRMSIHIEQRLIGIERMYQRN